MVFTNLEYLYFLLLVITLLNNIIVSDILEALTGNFLDKSK